MEFSHIIVRYGELTLKSGNRNEFLKKLTKNIRYNLQGLTGFHVQTKRDRMYIHLDHNEDVQEIMERLKKVPGIHNFSPVLRAGLDVEEAKKVAKWITYPVMIKATAGGGGKGMRIAHDEKELVENYIAAQNEAKAAFGNPDVYIEKYVEEPRHVEIQVIGDKFGNAVHLGERDCSIQRRHQKLIEEAPSAGIDAKTREKMGKFAAKLTKGIGYDSVGTLEFLVDKNMNFYFMEMNTRIQVEHTISEEITGVDLIKEQIKVAAGEKLSFSQKDINITGHAIECRINAEDSENGFLPSSGTLEKYIPAGGIGVRVDSHSYQNYDIPPYYDSMIAKLIVKGKTREEAIQRMKRALREFLIEGVDTTIPFHLKVLDNEDFKKGTIYTNFIETHFKDTLNK